VPHPYFCRPFADDDPAYSASHLIGKDRSFSARRARLARYDLKQKPSWSEEFISKQQIADAVKAENDSLDQASAGGNHIHRSKPANHRTRS